MIAYFDTSALVPLFIDEPGTELCQGHWSVAERVVSIRLTRVEARAALAHAQRAGRLTTAQLQASRRELDALIEQIDVVDIDDDVVALACDVAESQALRAYDAVHLAAAMRIVSDDLVLVAGDRALLAAAEAIGLSVAPIL